MGERDKDMAFVDVASKGEKVYGHAILFEGTGNLPKNEGMIMDMFHNLIADNQVEKAIRVWPCLFSFNDIDVFRQIGGPLRGKVGYIESANVEILSRTQDR